jgi:hypothetical protein
MSKDDPIRENYFASVEFVEGVTDVGFYVGAMLSLATVLVDQATYPIIFDLAQVAFGVLALAMFIVGLMLRLYLTPRAEDKRRQDFFGSACRTSLIHQKTEGYYNNDCVDPIKRIAAQVLENSHFSKAIALRMAKVERIRVSVYGLLWLSALLWRQTDLGVVVAASQAIFSEQIVAKWIRVEWLRMRCERTFDDMYRLFKARPPVNEFNAMVMEALSTYETAKANAAITLSSKMFDALNKTLSAEWDVIKRTLKI